MHTHTTQNIVDELILSIYGEAPDPRQHYVFSQALHGLVRQAKAEQMWELKMHMERSVGVLADESSWRQTREILRKIGMHVPRQQGQFHFDKEDSASSD